MKKIDMTPFMIKVRQSDGIEKEGKYGLKESLVEILYNPSLKLNAISLLRQEELAKKIAGSPDTELLLEEEEYTRLKTALETVQGLGKNDIELVHRVMDAITVEVSAKAA